MTLVTTSFVAITLTAGSAVFAQPLTGSGQHLPIPSPNPGAPANLARSVTTNTGGFTGSWSAPALSPWIGSFTAIGPVPGTTSSSAGVTLYDFTSMPTTQLPVGTFFRFGDVDQGAGQLETFVLQAFGSSGIVTSPWLDLPIGVSGTGISPTTTPGWSFNAGTGAYTIDGSSVFGNPNVAVYLTNNVALTGLELRRSTTFSTFSLHAPIPAPASTALLAAGGVLAIRRRRS
ncbi:MAG: PEP-CTERM sorting domain-containing protein [Planctomycetota bacterium]